MKLPAGYVPGVGVRKATAKGGLGERLLKSMGWSEGKGLGRQEDGISSALVVKKKDDAAGVGANAAKAVQWENRWWEAAFDSAAAKLQQDAESSDSSESEDTTAALPAAKRQRLHRDGTASTATEAEQAIAAALAKDRWGRFGGRDGKMARIRAQERLASAAAAAAAAAAEAAATTSAAGNTQPPSSPADAAVHPVNDAAGSSAAQSPPESDAQPAEAKRRLAGKKAKRAAAEEAQTAAVSASVEHAAAPKPRKRRKGSEPAAGLVVPAPDSDRSTSEQALAPKTWWGASRFVSSGCMTGLQRDGAAPAAQPRVEFSESTQEALYMAVHGAKTAGKKGLGRGSGSGVIAGAKWEGRRTVFEDSAGAANGDAPKQLTDTHIGEVAAPALKEKKKSVKEQEKKKKKQKAVDAD